MRELLVDLGWVERAVAGEAITDGNPDVREIAFDFVGDLGLPEHRSEEWLAPRTERLVKRIVEVVNKYRGTGSKALAQQINERIQGAYEAGLAGHASKELRQALYVASVRYTRDHGEPGPSPPVAFEVVFTVPQWAKVQTLLRSQPAEPKP